MMIKEKLLELEDKEYKKFHSKLCKNVNLIGIRIPVLRRYAKELYLKNVNNIDNLLNSIGTQYYEEVMLKGIIIGIDKKVDLDIFLERIKNFVPLIDNWAICDIFCAGLKLTKKYSSGVFKLIINYFESDKEFELRFAIVMFLNYFIDDKHILEVFHLIEKINNHEYYYEMSVSWALSVCLIDYFEVTINYLKESSLSNFIKRKTIQKALESYRINDVNKNILRKLKKEI